MGYVVVIVPPSSRAPHMVDGRYYGRADTTNYQLSDQEVRALWLQSLQLRDRGLELLHAEIAREPAEEDLRTTARLFAVAQPASADPRLLLDRVEGGNLRRWVSALGAHPIFERRQQYNPGIHSTSRVSRRARGAARSTEYVKPDRTVAQDGARMPSATDLVDLEFHEDGGIRLYYGRASDWLREGQHVLLTTAVIGEMSCVIELARHVAEVAGYRGSWTFGVALRGLRSATAYQPEAWLDDGWPYSEDGYDEVRDADHSELHAPESPILEDLLGRFVRALLPDDVSAAHMDIFPQGPGCVQWEEIERHAFAAVAIGLDPSRHVFGEVWPVLGLDVAQLEPLNVAASDAVAALLEAHDDS